MATWIYYDQVTEPRGWVQIIGGAPDRQPPRGHSRSAQGCEVALAALRAAGETGLPYPVLRAIVMHVGRCSEAAADQQLRTYARHHVGVRDTSSRREYARRASGTTQARIPHKDQIWRHRDFCGPSAPPVGGKVATEQECHTHGSEAV
jgi:hypothetical protein